MKKPTCEMIFPMAPPVACGRPATNVGEDKEGRKIYLCEDHSWGMNGILKLTRVPPLNVEAVISEVESILKGIDKTENETPDGWWETGTGAEFGGKKLDELKALLRDNL